MDIKRIKELAGLQVVNESPKYNNDPKVRAEIKGVRPSDELEFRRLASKMGGKNIELFHKGNVPVAMVTFEEEMWKDSNDKLTQFKKAWESHKSGVKESEEILEEKMTAAQKAKRERIVKAMKKDADKMKEKYGDDWESVMYATATKQALSEDHGKGFYVMVDGEEHCWCETKDEAEAKVEKLENEGKKATIKADTELKEDSHEEDEDNKEDAAEKSKEDSEEKAEAKDKKEVKEAVVDNFVQDDTDKDNTAAKRTGVDAMMNDKIRIPADVKTAVNTRIAELKKSIEFYDEKGYNDQSQKQKAIECLQQIMDDLTPANVEALKKAQIYFGTLMSPITDLFPSKLVNFLANAK